MKHLRLVTRRPKLSQTSNFEIFKDFLVNLTDQIIEFGFQKTN